MSVQFQFVCYVWRQGHLPGNTLTTIARTGTKGDTSRLAPGILGLVGFPFLPSQEPTG